MQTPLLFRLSLWIVLTAFFSSLEIQASNKIIGTVSGSNKVSMIENAYDHFRVLTTLGRLSTFSHTIDQGDFVELTAESYSKSNTVGAPQLPVLSRLIQVPEGSSITVKVISYNIREYSLSDFGISQKLLPVQPPESKNILFRQPLKLNKELYETNQFYSETLARVEIAGHMRSVQLANLILSPVEYNPVENSLRVYDNLLVEVRFVNAKKAQSPDTKAVTLSPYFSSIFSHVLNYQAADALPASDAPVKYVIVSDPMFRGALQPFVQWKTRRGFQVVEAYTDDPAVGKSTTSIKAYLKNLYTSATPADPAPTFVLFVGDVDQVPTFQCVNHVSDLYYCEYTGDYLPEVFYGRFSANTVAELIPQINKTLQYEQFKISDPSYLNNAILAAGADATHQELWGNGQINYMTSCYFNTAHNFAAHTFLQPEPAGSNYSKSIQSEISQGVSFANYSAHGGAEGWANPSFTIADIANLKNEGKYGLIVGNSCQTSAYNLESFGEALVRAENKGAVGYIGTSDLSYWDEDFWWTVGSGSIVSNPKYENTGLGAYDRIFHDHGEPSQEWCSTMGQMFLAGNLAVQESNSTIKQYYWEIYNLLGDPSTMIYFSAPTAMTARYDPLIPVGSTTFEVQTEPYAAVAVSQKSKLNAVAEADENGLAVVHLQPFSNPGFADIVITKQNRQPYIDSVKVATPEGPYLMLESFNLNDSIENNNGLPESGEQLTIGVSLNNFGLSEAVNAFSIITSHDEYVTVINPSHVWPAIPGKSKATASNAFTIQINGNVPDLHEAAFTIKTQTDTNTFTSECRFVVYAPHLTVGDISINDSAGNGNRQIEPGETISVTAPVTNNGHAASGSVSTRLFAFGGNALTHANALNLGSLSPGERSTSVSDFTVKPDALPGSDFSLYLSAEADSYHTSSVLQTKVGAQSENFETGDFTKYHWQPNGNKPWEICSSEKSEGSFSSKSGAINNSESSTMELSGQVLSSGTISFYRKVSSENGYDFLWFYIDDTEMGSWSGEKDWLEVSYTVTAGKHIFRWVYEKDEANAAGQDAAWVDNIQLPAFGQDVSGQPSLQVVAEPQTLCAGDTTQLFALICGGTGVNSYRWNSLKSGDSVLFNPKVMPSCTSTYQVQVQNGNATATGQVTVYVNQLPDTPFISPTGDHLVSTSATGNQWYNSQGPVNGANAKEFYPQSSDAYYVVATNAEGCSSNASNKVEFEFAGIENKHNKDFSVSPNPFTSKVFLDFTTRSAGQIFIMIYNSSGTLVGNLDEGRQSFGNHRFTFDGSRLPNGIYYCKICSCDFMQVARLIKIE